MLVCDRRCLASIRTIQQVPDCTAMVLADVVNAKVMIENIYIVIKITRSIIKSSQTFMANVILIGQCLQMTIIKSLLP